MHFRDAARTSPAVRRGEVVGFESRQGHRLIRRNYFSPHFRFERLTGQAIIAQHPQETRLSGLLADAEGTTTPWVTRHVTRFASRSILSSASSSEEPR